MSSSPKKGLTVDFEKLVRKNWTKEETANAKMMADFVQRMMNDHDFDAVLQKYDNAKYVQHNHTLPDGVKGVVGFLQKFVKSYPDYCYDVKAIHCDGDVVIFHSHVTINEKHRGKEGYGLIIMDKWRIEDGLIAEHWDSIQPLDFSMRLYTLFSGGTVRNSNGIFY